jgi:predicted nucleic acid-binding protein
MESALLGLVLDSSTVISAERNKQSIPEFIEAILRKHGPLDLSLSPVTVAELVHGIYRAKTPEAAQRRRAYIEELVNLVPVHPVTNRTALHAEHRVAGRSDRRARSGERKHTAV